MRSILTLAFLFYGFGVLAQDDVFSNKTNIALEKVVKDFPNRFHNIKGELIVQRAQTAEYKSTIQVPGSSSCIITATRNSSNSDAYSWNCVAFMSPDFNLAKDKFKEIFDQIENTIIRVDGQKPFIISGQYRTPVEERKFVNIPFELLPAAGDMKKLKIELDLQYVATEWKVSLNVYESNQKEEESTAVVN